MSQPLNTTHIAPKSSLLFVFFFCLNAFAAQPEVVLQGTAQGTAKPVLLFQGAVNADSSKLPPTDEASVWSDRMIRAINLSGSILTASKKPDSLVPGIAVPNARLEVRKASSGGAATVSLYAGDAIRPYWFQSFSFAEKPLDGALDAAGTLHMQLIGVAGFASARLYYAGRTSKGNREVFSCDMLGQNRTQHTFLNNILLSPTISPDGTKMCYTSFKNGTADIWIQSTSANDARVLYSTPYLDSSPAFSPDNKTVCFASSFSGDMHIYSIGIDGRNLVQLTFGSDICTSPSWSPKGDRIAFASDRSGNVQVYSMAPDGTDVRRITYEGDYNDSPCWSPQADRIIYVRRENETFQLYQTDPAGVTHKRLLYYSEDQKDPAFAPGGFRVSFVTTWRGQEGIALVTPETGDVDLIVSDVEAQRPAWGPPLTK